MLRDFVLHILGGRFEAADTEPPALEHEEHRSFVGRALAGRDPRRDPLHLAVEDGFRVVRSSMPGGCGGSTAQTLHIPWSSIPRERRLIGAHEWLHGHAKRLGLTEATEADVWWCILRGALLDAAPDESGTVADGARRPIEGLEDVGVGVDPDIPALRLGERARDGYMLEQKVLVAHLQEALKLSTVPVGTLPDEVMQVGRRQMRAQALMVFLALAPPGDLERLSATLRDRVNGERLVLLAPPELQDDGAIDIVPLHDWLPPFGDLVDHFYRRLKLRAEMDIEEVAGNARLIVRADGVYLDRKKLDITAAQHIKFVRLVIAHGLSKSAAELGDELRVAGDGTMLGETIAHQAKQAVARAIAKALPLAPKSAETQVKQILKNSRGRGYEFLVEPLDLTADEAG